MCLSIHTLRTYNQKEEAHAPGNAELEALVGDVIIGAAAVAATPPAALADGAGTEGAASAKLLLLLVLDSLSSEPSGGLSAPPVRVSNTSFRLRLELRKSK